MTGQLAGKRCLIVGGTSGIGLAIAQLFATHGASVSAAGLPGSRETSESADGSLTTSAITQGKIDFLAMDATKSAEVERVVGEVWERWQGLDVLCHSAGISGRRLGDGPLHECTDDGWNEVLRTNLTSVFLTNRAVARRWLDQQLPGVILNVASVLATRPAPAFFDTVAYAASKGGIISLSRLLAASYAKQRIRVNVLAPGLVDTPMATRAVNDPTIAAYLRTKQPLAGGPCSPEACAEAALYLCSDAARFVTGQVIAVDAGWSVCEGQSER